MDSPHPELQGPGRLCLVRAHAGFLAGAHLPSSLRVFHKGIDIILRILLQLLTTQSLLPDSHLGDRSPDVWPVTASLSMPDSGRHMSILQLGWLRPELGTWLLALESPVGPMAMLLGAMWCGSVVWEQVPCAISCMPCPWHLHVFDSGHCCQSPWLPYCWEAQALWGTMGC